VRIAPVSGLPDSLDRDACAALDAGDPLAPMRGRFVLDEGLIYLDGNSLGALPAATPPRLARVVGEEWGRGLIGSWNDAGWIEAPRRLGDKVAGLIGAEAGEVLVADSTSVNLFKLLAGAVRARPGRRVVLSHADNFPADLYVAQGLCELLDGGCELRTVAPAELAGALDADVAVLMVTHVDYATGAVQDMAALSAAARGCGALSLWDLSHSTAALPVDLGGCGADLAVGCGYKYLNGGPGAPAFAWAHPRHTLRMDAEQRWQPLSGWLGHAAPFEFTPSYRPAAGVARFVCGTPPVIAMAALECGIDTLLAAEPLGGIAALRRKSVALTELFIRLVESRCAGHGLVLHAPRDAERRGSQASFARAEGGYAIMQALIARGVIGDFRAPDLLRFGFTPLYTRFVDVWDAVEHLAQVLQGGEWREARFNQRAAVT